MTLTLARHNDYSGCGPARDSINPYGSWTTIPPLRRGDASSQVNYLQPGRLYGDDGVTHLIRVRYDS